MYLDQVQQTESFDPDIHSLAMHSHPCSIYANKEQLKQQFVPYLRNGLALGEKCVYFIDENDEKFVINAMDGAGIDIRKYLKSGQFEVIHTSNAHLLDGHFSEQKMLAYWNHAIETAQQNGFHGLRAAVEMTWALSNKPGCEILAPYESRLTNLMSEKKASVICMYSRRKFPADKIKAIIHAHPLVVTGNASVLRNLACPPPEKYEEGSVNLDVQVLLDNLELISELQSTKKELQNRHLKDVSFELLVASVKDYAIYWLDPQGKIMTWNQGAERIKGYEAADVVGQHFSKFYTPEAIAQRHPDRELELAKQNGRYEEEGPRVRKDGSIFWASVVITALYQDGKHVGFAKVTRDLTERKRAEEAREAAMEQVSEVNRELQHLAYTISHELQQPIASITSSTKLLLTRYKDRWGEDADDFLNEIEKGALMTAKMVDDLWTYARVTKPGGERKIVNLAKLAERTKQELEELISKLNSEVLLIPVNDSPRVECNEKQIAYVIKEMITNAIKHYKGNGKPRLEISIIPERSGWTMNFKDNGVGIDKFFAKQVFAIYQRLNGKPDETGTGMGLPICKKIVESEHHGIIGFENCVDAGTNFYFWLPTGPGNPVCSYLA